ncbi:MAG: hypothetical protein ACOYNI_08690 [Acidimicrobiia bacterium]
MVVAIVFAVLMVTVFPALVFIGGAVWSGVMGHFLMDDVDEAADGEPATVA